MIELNGHQYETLSAFRSEEENQDTTDLIKVALRDYLDHAQDLIQQKVDLNETDLRQQAFGAANSITKLCAPWHMKVPAMYFIGHSMRTAVLNRDLYAYHEYAQMAEAEYLEVLKALDGLAY
jgi:hypothetical protein